MTNPRAVNAVSLNELQRRWRAVRAGMRERGIDALYALGELAAHAVRAFGEGGRHYVGIETLLVDVGAALGPQVAVLVKGSRFMQMERVVRSFEDSTAEA